MIYPYERMKEDAAFVKKWKPLSPRRRFLYMVRWWCCMLRWLRWVREANCVHYTFFVVNNNTSEKYRRAIHYAICKGKP